MNQNAYYLAHHGILGMKWGKKNGPPYPLDYDKLSEEEREKAKKSAIERGDLKEANKNVKYFTNKEIDEVIARFDKRQKLADLSTEHIKTGMEKVKEFSDKMQTIGDAFNKGANTYNAIAKVANAFTGTELPIVGQNNNNNNNNNNQNKNKNDVKDVNKLFKVDGKKVKSEKVYKDLLGREVHTTKNYDKKKDKEKSNNDNSNSEKKTETKAEKTKEKYTDKDVYVPRPVSKTTKVSEISNDDFSQTSINRIRDTLKNEKVSAINIDNWNVQEHTPSSRLSGSDYERQLSNNERDFLNSMYKKR